jgi:radical SAM superfamily enzyme YgiQ (UPF0313 family)
MIGYTNGMSEVLIFTECNGSIGWGRDAGAYTIASHLRAQGVTTQAIDFFSCFDETMWRKMVDRYVSDETLLMGFSSTHFSSLRQHDWEAHFKSELRGRKNANWNTYFPQSSEEIQSWFDYARQKNPRLKFVVGGQKVAQKRKLQEKYPMVDFWLGGMAENAIVGLVQELRGGHSKPRRVACEAEFGTIPESRFSDSMIRWIADDYLFEDEALPLELSRGCPFRCSFCDYRKKKPGTWIKNWDVVRQSLIETWEQFGIRHYMITDFLVNESLDKVKNLADLAESLPFDFQWSGFGRLDLLQNHEEMLDELRRSGLKSIQWGIESIRKEVGPLIGKTTEREKVEVSLEMCRKNWGDQVVMGSGFIVGLPGETDESAWNLFNWLSEQPWLHGWEVTPLFIGQFDENKTYTIDFSQIQRNPEKFGYQVEMQRKASAYTENWTHGNFSKARAIELIEEYQQSQPWKRRVLTTYHGYSRMHNLGFGHDEILKMNHENESWIDSMAQRYREKSNHYLSKVLDGDL